MTWIDHERAKAGLPPLPTKTGRILIGVSGHFSAAHRDQDTGEIHGHTWHVLAKFEPPGRVDSRCYKAALRTICNSQGYPITKIHLLRGLNPKIFTQLPASSADSTNVGRNIGIDSRWKGTYQPKSKTVRTRILVDRIEHFNSACRLEMEYDL